MSTDAGPSSSNDALPELKKRRTVCRSLLTKVFNKAEAEIHQYNTEADKSKAYAVLSKRPTSSSKSEQKAIKVTSDIEKAFLQIRLEAYERKFTKFLWLSDPNDIDIEFVTYLFKSVLFGAVCSPFILNAVITAQMEAGPENQTAADLKQDIYVDDVISESTKSEAVQYYEEANKLMDSSGFNLCSWSSNSQAA
ncbi:uncharacterized protein [Ptychodera flava]|uniref:uncharacterized protein n=1 Tax=Ptychodera flava TaxID=63121 RepID=UPI00396A9DFD